MSLQMNNKVNVLMVGTGEYTTGYVGGTATDSDKGAGVVALTMFDLRRRGKVDRVAMCGVNVRIFQKIAVVNHRFITCFIYPFFLCVLNKTHPSHTYLLYSG
jgi:hypothetical protein